jgi:tRNA(Ile)-lysidine synthase
MLEKRVQQWEERLLPRGSRVAVGVSGGPDSMALLHRLWSMATEREWSVSAIHVNHGLRGVESTNDARHVQSWCRERGIACQVEEVDVAGFVRVHGGNKQAVARRLRYEAFYRCANALAADFLALAHHADDQVETLLMRLIRGTGAQGLTGIPRRRHWRGLWIIRPWLDVTREEILAYCKRVHLPFRLDRSNEENAYTRNRIRHELTPLLAELNPRFREAFVQLSTWMTDEEAVWNRLTKDAFEQVCVREDGKRITLDVDRFTGLEIALQRRVIKLILSCLVKESAMDATGQAVERIRVLAASDVPSARTPLPGGGWAWREYRLLHVSPSQERDKLSLPEATPLSLPGETNWMGGCIRAWIRSSDSPPPFSSDPSWAVFDRDRLPSPLVVRARRPGDRIHPFGLGGSKKVKDLLIDAKVPKAKRDQIPMVTAGDLILWIPGVARSDVAPWGTHTRETVVLHWEPNATSFDPPSDT